MLAWVKNGVWYIVVWMLGVIHPDATSSPKMWFKNKHIKYHILESLPLYHGMYHINIRSYQYTTLLISTPYWKCAELKKLIIAWIIVLRSLLTNRKALDNFRLGQQQIYQWQKHAKVHKYLMSWSEDRQVRSRPIIGLFSGGGSRNRWPWLQIERQGTCCMINSNILDFFTGVYQGIARHQIATLEIKSTNFCINWVEFMQSNPSMTRTLGFFHHWSIGSGSSLNNLTWMTYKY